MTPARNRRPLIDNGPLIHPFARERLRALLPELVVSIAAATCMTSVVTYTNGMDVGNLVLIMGISQLLVQTFLYACTYLTGNTVVASMGWMILAMCMPIPSMLASMSGVPGLASGPLNFSVTITAMLGAMLFYFSRLRVTFALLLLEMFILSAEVDAHAATLLLHYIGAACYAALFVMRGAATHVTMFDDGLLERMTRHNVQKDDVFPALGIRDQITILGVAVAAMCLSVVLIGMLILGGDSDVGGSATESTIQTSGKEEQVESRPAPSADGASDADGATGDTGAARVDSTPAGDSEPVGQQPAGPVVDIPPVVIVAVAIAVVAAPFCVKMGLRARERRSIAREAKLTDRVARLYCCILDRLDAAGITREGSQTPQEFLAEHGAELAELTAPAGIGIEGWTLLTNTFERARYGALDPTDFELQTCWKIYDALKG